MIICHKYQNKHKYFKAGIDKIKLLVLMSHLFAWFGVYSICSVHDCSGTPALLEAQEVEVVCQRSILVGYISTYIQRQREAQSLSPSHSVGVSTR